jgi:hypothetical protein
MNPPKLLQRLFLLPLVAATMAAASAFAQPTSFDDAIGDIDSGISTGGGTLDIVKMEVFDTVNDVIFKLTVNGSIASTDWGTFMIGIANQKSAGTTTGNGWGRPINLNAGGGNGMTHWIGSWVNGGGGSQLWTYDGAGWNGPEGLKRFSLAAGATSTITYAVTKASLGVVTGDTIQFDAYSSGGDGSSSVDALSNPNVAITGWGGPYTSVTPFISSYTLSDSAPITTQNITFRVDMSFQAEQGNFDPLFDLVEVVPVGSSAFARTDMAEVDGEPGVYAATVSITAAQGDSVGYQFSIADPDADVPEDLTRNFEMPDAATVLPVVYFDNLQGVRDVTFSVDMSVYIANDLFNPNEGIVEVRGPFNGWAGTALAPVTNGVYSGTVQLIGGLENEAIPYKFWRSGLPNPDDGYESGDNRTFNLALNADGSPTPAQVLTPTPYFNNITGGRNVTFTVDMTVMEALGRFTSGPDSVVKVVGNFNDWDTGAETYKLTEPDTNGIYTGTFFIPGNEGFNLQYKFFSPSVVYYTGADAGNTGYEIVSQADPLLNRTTLLGPIDTPQPLASVFFSDQLFGVMDTANFPLPASSFTNFVTTQGTPSETQSVAISGLNLTNDVVATAPAGFQLSVDGTNYSGSVNLIPTAGTLSSATLFARVASSASAGVQTNLSLLLTSTGSQFTDIRIGSDVTASGQTFAGWSGGQTLTPALELEYAIGGASAPGAGDGVASVTTVTADTLSITAVVRTNDPTLTVTGQAVVDLAVGPWTTNNVTVTPQPEAEAPEGCEVQTFSTPNGTDGKKFLRLQTSLPAAP